MEVLRVVCVLVFALVCYVKAEVQCQPDLIGYTKINLPTERCYQLVYESDERRTWADARQYCQDQFGRLVNIDDLQKQELVESIIAHKDNGYKPPAGYDPMNSSTWNGFDPDIWMGASRDSDGVTWRFDTFTQSRTSRSSILDWFYYGTDTAELDKMEIQQNRYIDDVCMFLRFGTKTKTLSTGINVTVLSLPWYAHLRCSSKVASHNLHPFICEYDTYEYVTSQSSSWLIVIALLGVCVCCGFISCALYCLWDKIHTSYNVLQV